jgi:hypothetical protein
MKLFETLKDLQDSGYIREKLRLFVTQVAEMIGDNDEGGGRPRARRSRPDKLEYQD